MSREGGRARVSLFFWCRKCKCGCQSSSLRWMFAPCRFETISRIRSFVERHVQNAGSIYHIWSTFPTQERQNIIFEWHFIIFVEYRLDSKKCRFIHRCRIPKKFLIICTKFDETCNYMVFISDLYLWLTSISDLYDNFLWLLQKSKKKHQSEWTFLQPKGKKHNRG